MKFTHFCILGEFCFYFFTIFIRNFFLSLFFYQSFHEFVGRVFSKACEDVKLCRCRYENVGYKSSASYKSSYRQTNFPTLNVSFCSILECWLYLICF